MRKIRELLRLKFEQGLSERKIAIALSVSRAAVSECTVTVPVYGCSDNCGIAARCECQAGEESVQDMAFGTFDPASK
jgi:hypothetical protein